MRTLKSALVALLVLIPLSSEAVWIDTLSVTAMEVEDLYQLSLEKKTLEGTLESLPDVFKSNFVLSYNSPSMQASSFQQPRAILFNEDASLVITFNGDPEARGYNHLEAAQFIRKEARWEFYDIAFDGDAPVLSEPNPVSCMACHQYPSRSSKDPRPNWEPYNVWPTMYGSLGGTLVPKIPGGTDSYYSVANLTNIENHLPGFLKDQNQEGSQLECFINRQVFGLKDVCASESHDSSERYSHLKLDQENKRAKINAGLHDLSRHLAQNNFRRVLRLMKSEPFYESVKYSLGALLLGQAVNKTNPGTYIDFTNRACAAPLSPENMQLLVSAHEAWSAPMNGYYLALSTQDLLPDRDRLNLTRFIDLLFGPRVGPEFMDWSMDFRTGGKFLYNNYRRFRASGSAAGAFAKVFFEDEPEMAEMSCEEISTVANEKLTEGFRSGLLDSRSP